MIFKIVHLIYFIIWPAIILISLYIAVKRKIKEAIVPLSIASFFLIFGSVLAAYEKFTNSELGEVNFGIALVTFIISFICSIIGLVAFVKNE